MNRAEDTEDIITLGPRETGRTRQHIANPGPLLALNALDPPLYCRRHGRGFTLATAAELQVILPGYSLLRVLQAKREPTSGLEPLTKSHPVTSCALRLHTQSTPGAKRFRLQEAPVPREW